MKSRVDSRNSIIDTEKCVENAGGRYSLVIAASQYLRELKRKNKNSDKLITCIDALKDIQENNVDMITMMTKVK
jgi:DNA-directed RNA polymerase subunit K/omega